MALCDLSWLARGSRDPKRPGFGALFNAPKPASFTRKYDALDETHGHGDLASGTSGHADLMLALGNRHGEDRRHGLEAACQTEDLKQAWLNEQGGVHRQRWTRVMRGFHLLRYIGSWSALKQLPGIKAEPGNIMNYARLQKAKISNRMTKERLLAFDAKVRKTPSWPRSWANFSPL